MSTRLDEARAALAHHRTQRDAPPDLFSPEVERVADNAGQFLNITAGRC